jgi:hypothetical protein
MAEPLGVGRALSAIEGATNIAPERRFKGLA